MRHYPLHNHNVAVYVAETTSFSFAVYGFNSGHFVSTRYPLPFQVAMAADPLPNGRAMFKKFAHCTSITDSADGLLQMVTSSKANSLVHGYIIHSHKFAKRATEEKFWKVQAAIVRALRSSRNLISLCVYIHHSCDMVLANGFKNAI